MQINRAETLRMRHCGGGFFVCGCRRLLFFFWLRSRFVLIFFLRQLLLQFRFRLGFFFPFFLALGGGFLRRQNRVQRSAFLPRTELHDTEGFHVLDQALQNLPAQAGAGHFAAAEKNRGLYFVSAIQKAQHVIFFGLVIVVVHIDAELDLFYGNRFLVFLSFALFLFLLIEIFPVVHDAADRRLRRGRNLNQVQVLAFGQFKRSEGRHYADLFTFVSDHANFARPDAVIGSDKAFIDTVLRARSDWE